MKQAAIFASLALSGLLIASTAQAATVGQAFNVTATLVSVCASNNTTPTDVNFGAYTAFGTAATPAPTTTISFKCTRGATAPSAASLNSTTGSIKGVNYSLAVGAVSAAPGTAGNPDIYSYVITGTMAAGQAGDVNGTAGPVVHTLTITY